MGTAIHDYSPKCSQIMLVLPKDQQNVLVLPTVGSDGTNLEYFVGLHGNTGKAKTHFG